MFNLKIGETFVSAAGGIEPDKKDIMRMQSMRENGKNDNDRIFRLANKMANTIKDADKMERRAKAAEKVFSGKRAKEVANIFRRAAKKL